MLLERNQAVIGFVVAAVIGVLTFFAVGLSGGAFKSGTPLTAVFTDAAAIESGDYVFVAGIRTGSVTGVEIEGETAVVDFLLEAEDVPNDSTVSISVENLLGRRALIIEPGNSPTPFAEGDVIPLARTDTPVDLPELGNETVDLLATADIDALQALNTALADITEGARQDVETLLVGLEDVGNIVGDRATEIDRALASAERIATIVEEKDDELLTVIDNFNVVLADLVANRQDLSRLLDSTAVATDTAATLLEERRAQIDRVLSELARDLAILDAHQVDVAAIMAYMGISIEGFASIGYENGNARTYTPNWGNVFVTGLGAVGQDALFGCNGSFDQLLSALVGPDPQCEATAASQARVAAFTPGVDTIDRPLTSLFTDVVAIAGGTTATTTGGLVDTVVDATTDVEVAP